MENWPEMKMYFLLKIGIFQPAMLVYQRVCLLHVFPPHVFRTLVVGDPLFRGLGKWDQHMVMWKPTRRPDGPPTILGIRKHVPGSGLGEMGEETCVFFGWKKHTHTKWSPMKHEIFLVNLVNGRILIIKWFSRIAMWNKALLSPIESE